MAATTVADALGILLTDTAATTGHGFFRALARAMTKVFGTSHAMVARRVGDGQSVEALAFYAHGEFVEGVVYDLEGTPCAGVVGTGSCQVTRDLQRSFPDDAMLRVHGLQAYFGVPVRRPDGEVIGILVALDDKPREPIADIDAILGLFGARAAAELDRLEAERQRAKSDERYRQIVTTTSEGVWVIDEHNATTYVNPQMARMLGFEPEEMLGRPVEDFTDEEGRQRTQGNVQRRQEGISERHEFQLIRKDGSSLWTSMSTNPLTDDEGRYVGALAMVTDLSEMRALQAHIEHAQKLESLGRLAGEIAHDFNNLLAGVSACAELLLAQGPAAGQSETLRQIVDASLQGRGLTRQILTYAGRDRFEARAVELNRVVTEVGELLRIGLRSDATLRVALTTEASTVLADLSQLHQVVMNLVTNASQALGHEGGTIDVTTRVEVIDAANPGPAVLGPPLVPGRYVVLEVRDDGCGMDEATRARVFDPFFSTKDEGRGLGLAVVRGIVHAHDGRLALDTAPGRGTRFQLYLQQHQVAPAEEAAAAPEAPRWRGHGLVLLVDDQVLPLRAARALLGHLGFDVETATGGRDAVAKAEDLGDRLRLVMMDLRMPGMDGREALTAMRAAGVRAPAILCTGLAEELGAAETGELFAAVLHKPYLLAELRGAVRGTLGEA